MFGEGVNPRLRKIRDGLTELGLDADELLRHGAPRLVYCVALVRNLWAYLLGMEKTPRYILPQLPAPAKRRGASQDSNSVRLGQEPNPILRGMVTWWLRRWLRGRLQRDDVLQRVAGHNFVHPIRHGARVVLPPDREQPLLFGE